ncbi:MAG: lipid-A-disaccharide synthase [Burkholderiales bacterium]
MRIGIIAGEASGDMLGAHLIAALQARFKYLEFIGIAGPRMQALGAKSLFPMEKLAVRGYIEVLKHFREIRSIQRYMTAHFLRDPPDLFIGIDAPDFNLGVEERLKAAGITTVHHVSPSIWAWRRERIHKIKRAVSRVLTLFPFEAAIYEQAGIPVSYVGHPLADVIALNIDQQAARQRLGLKGSGPIIALLPGSRQSELDNHAELFVRTAMVMQEKLSQAKFIAPFATVTTQQQFATTVQKLRAQSLPLICLQGESQSVLAAADITLIASGTATLEAALLKCPMVITYRVSAATAWLMRRKGHGYLPYIGLPNILASEFIVPELLQEDATPENLAQALLNWLGDASMRDKLRSRFRHIHESLRQNSSVRIADALAPYITQ